VPNVPGSNPGPVTEFMLLFRSFVYCLLFRSKNHYLSCNVDIPFENDISFSLLSILQFLLPIIRVSI